MATRTRILALLALIMANAGHAGEVILDVSGNRSTTTRSFEVEGPWLLEWRVNSDFRDQTGFELNLMNADTGFFESRILLTRRTGNGLKLFSETGRFQFEVVSNFADWYLTVEALSEEEAAAYREASN
ncbi:MAG: hypothetical protein AAF290_03855 [Pseudomonadota bacterium]